MPLDLHRGNSTATTEQHLGLKTQLRESLRQMPVLTCIGPLGDPGATISLQPRAPPYHGEIQENKASGPPLEPQSQTFPPWLERSVVWYSKCSETHPHIYRQVLFDKGAKVVQWRKDSQSWLTQCCTDSMHVCMRTHTLHIFMCMCMCVYTLHTFFNIAPVGSPSCSLQAFF